MAKILRLYLVTFSLIITSNSCIDKEQCVKDYLEADEWMEEKTYLAGDNQAAKDAIYQEYLRRYKEIDARCKN